MHRLLQTAGVVAFASLLAVGVTGCGSPYRDQVIGAWDWNIGAGTLVVTVNADGTGSLKGPTGEKKITWRIQRGNNFIINDGTKDSGFLIDSADENTIRGTDPQSPGQKIIWTRKK